MLPLAAEPLEITRLSQLARQSFTNSSLELIGVRGIIVTESVFNQHVSQLGSKGLALSRWTLALAAELLASNDLHGLHAEVYCDRQGGRKNYLPLLLDAMPDRWFEETQISHARCSYRSWGAKPVAIHFSVQGDRFPPTALASMLAKSLREYIMRAFNNFWRGHLPDLKPTAGYPLDARRFRAEVQTLADQLGFQESSWWRCR
jgi:hypothetical protein